MPANDQKFSVLLAAIALAIVVSLNFPAVVYKANAEDFEIAFGYSALVLIGIGAVLSAALWLPSAFMNSMASKIYASALAVIALEFWVLGTFLIGNRGILNGTTPLRSDTLVYGVSELVMALLVLFLLVWLFQKKVILIRFVVLVLLLTSVGSLVVTLTSEEKSYALTKKDDSFYQVSSQKNVFVFLFDAFLSDLFEDILKKEPRLADEFDGFTYFPQTTGVAPTTYLSLPAIHSGLPYAERLSLPEYYNRGVRKGSFISKLAAKGYDAAGINFVKMAPEGAEAFRGREMSEGALRTSIKEAFYLFDISLYRAVPSILKDSIYDDGEWFTSKLFSETLAAQSNQLLRILGQRFHPSHAKPAVRWIHLYSTHPPASQDAECNTVRHQKWNRENAQNQARCAVNLFIDVMQQFKKNHIYDNSAIFLIADHGIGFSRDQKPPLLSSARPIFLVKPTGKHGKLKISDSTVFLTDLPKTVCALTGDCAVPKGISAFDAESPLRNKRSSIFFDYTWRNAYWSRKHLSFNARYLLTGSGTDIMSWYKIIDRGSLNGQRLSFDQNDNPDAFGFGWSEPARGKSRAVLGRYAQVYLPLTTGKDVTLTIKLQTPRANTNQHLTLFIDDQQIGSEQLPAGKEVTLSFQIPASAITKAVTRLTFAFTEAHEPENQREFRRERLTAVAASFKELQAN